VNDLMDRIKELEESEKSNNLMNRNLGL
jgi:hypothetical protein